MLKRSLTTALIGGKDIALGLDCPGAQQYVPMGSAGYRGKGRRHHYQLSPGAPQRCVEFGKAHIVTDAQAEPSYGGIDTDEVVAEAILL